MREVRASASAAISWALLAALAGACGGHHADAGDAAELIDAATIIDASPTDASPIDAEIIDAPPAVCEPVPTPPVLPPALAASGTRLVPRYLAEPVTGGVNVAHAIWDSTLGINCEPMPYHDGTIRCVPPAQDLHLLGARRFADAARTIPIAVEPLGAAPGVGALAAVYQGSSSGPFACGGARLSPFARFGALRGGTQYYNEIGGAQPVPEGYGIFDLTVLADDFVVLSEVRTQLSGAIAVRELHGTDGSRLFATDLWDTAHDVPVGITTVGGTRRLLPPRQGRLQGLHRAPPPGGMVDETWCASRDDIFNAPNPGGPCPGAVHRFITDDAYETHHVVMQTATLYGCGVAPGVGVDAGTPAMQVLTSETRSYLASCERVPASEWQEAIAVTEGSGRLTTSVFSIGGASFEWNRFRVFSDATLGIDCAPRTASDGSLRCLPLVRGGVAYADAACTSRVVASNQGPMPYVLEGSIPSSSFPDPRGNITVHGVGALRPASTIYFRSLGACAPSNLWTSYEIGPVVPPSTFVELELRDAP